MKEALDRRHAAEWRRLGDFVLRETLAVRIDAPSDSPLAGFRRTREYDWYVRDGWAIRSPVRVDGIVVGDERRRGYERDWRRAERRRRAALKTGSPEPEPRFVADFHYFLEWGLEPGDCYFVGRESAAGREVVRLECYPAARFLEEASERIARGIRKTSTLTLWVDPEAGRIVKYAFENSGLDSRRGHHDGARRDRGDGHAAVLGISGGGDGSPAGRSRKPPMSERKRTSLFASRRERRLWAWTLAVVVAIYSTLGLARTRSHLIEYGVVAAFMHEALRERARHGRRVPAPALLTVLATGLVGVLDECIQLLLPSRVFDPLDMLFNVPGGVMAVSASAALGWARPRHG